MKFHLIAPSIIFLLAILYLHFSPLTISKAISAQTEVLTIFMKTLSEKDVLFAVIESFQYILTQIILPLLPFLLLTSFGFFILFLFKEEIEFKPLSLVQVLFLVIAVVVTNFSIVMILAYVGILVASLLSFKTFEVRKTNFSTAKSLVSSNLRWVNIFLTIGLFLTLYINFQSYEGLMIQANVNLVKSFVPDVESLQTTQSQLVNKTVDGIKQSILDQYQQVPQQTKEQCGALYDAMIVGLDNYKEAVAEQVESQEISGGQIENIVGSIPIITQIVKATPLVLALVLISLLEFLKPFVAFGFGITYSLLKKLLKTKVA